MSDAEYEASAWAALDETLGNMFYLINKWAELDLQRMDGILSVEEVNEEFSQVVRIIGTGLWESLQSDPTTFLMVLAKANETDGKMKSLLNEVI